MKFNKDANKIFKLTKNYLTNIEEHIVNFKNFCKEIVEGDYPSFESQCYYRFYQDANTMINIIHNNISDMLFKLQQKYDDKERASVLYPYEKQAIYEYFKKPDLKRKYYKKFGCIYAEKLKVNDKEVISIGISVCNDKDEFSKNVALNLAKKRAREYFNKYDIRVTPETKGIPFTRIVHVPTKNMYEDTINKFIKRCKRWFKDETILYPTNIIFTEFPDKTKKKSDKITNEPMPF